MEVLDTDGDGVSDDEEKRIGTDPSKCDTDVDGLSDGVELEKIQPVSKDGCHGLQPAGTNYERPHIMDPLNPDSDGDGLEDGEEDKNENGWVDPDESDPSIEDTDGDGLDDYIETVGDFDGDDLPDFDFQKIKSGAKCSPPKSIFDLDCDAVPNCVDLDSDDDGCPDLIEKGWIDSNSNGIPDVYDNQAKTCQDAVTTSPLVNGNGKPKKKNTEEKNPPQASTSGGNSSMPLGFDDGPACSLRPVLGYKEGFLIDFIIIMATISLIFLRREINEKPD